MKLNVKCTIKDYQTNVKGFSLIELLVVLVMISALSAIAYPSYHRHLRKAERQTAQAALMAFGQAMERARLRHPTGQYPNPAPGYPPPADHHTDETVVRLEDIYPLQIPADDAIKRWQLGLAMRTAGSFRLYANAIGPSSGEGCLIYESTGRRCHLPHTANCARFDCRAPQSRYWN